MGCSPEPAVVIASAAVVGAGRFVVVAAAGVAVQLAASGETADVAFALPTAAE